jgi:hypothetical protein
MDAPTDNPMQHGNSTQELTFGYLSAVRSAEHGYFGGYLVISALGRPLEFHCSAPVRPSRAQEILFGPTLEPYLLGEQIGGTLLGRAKTSPRLIITDQSAVLCLRPRIEVPLVRFVPHHEVHAQPADSLADRDRSFVIRGHEFDLAPGFVADRAAAMELLAELAVRVDLSEPFDRIHEAIREAQRIGSRGQDAHGQAA